MWLPWDKSQRKSWLGKRAGITKHCIAQRNTKKPYHHHVFLPILMSRNFTIFFLNTCYLQSSNNKLPNASIGISTSWESSADSQEWRRHSAAEGRDFKSQDNIWAQSEADEAEGSIRQSGSIKAYLDGWRTRTLGKDSFKPFAVIHLCFLWYVILKWI